MTPIAVALVLAAMCFFAGVLVGFLAKQDAPHVDAEVQSGPSVNPLRHLTDDELVAGSMGLFPGHPDCVDCRRIRAAE